MNRRETGRCRRGDKLWPTGRLCLQISHRNGGTTMETIKAWALVTLQLKELEGPRALGRGRYDVQSPLWVGEKESGRFDIEQPGTVRGQAAQEIDGIKAVDKAVRHEDECLGESSLSIPGHDKRRPCRPNPGAGTSESSSSWRSMIAQATALAVIPFENACARNLISASDGPTSSCPMSIPVA